MVPLKTFRFGLLATSAVLIGGLLDAANASAVPTIQSSRRRTEEATASNVSLINPSFGQKGSKVCVAWGNGPSDTSLAYFKTSHVIGLYDWAAYKPDAADQLGFDYWPMLWGGDQDKISAFESAVTSGFGTILLGFNEPNEEGQSNLSPVQAAELWMEYIEPKRSLGYKTCSPAVSARPNGQQWMQQFLQACSGCTVDYQCLHWYGIGFDNLQVYLEEYHDIFGLPILLTEFADQDFNAGTQPSLADVISFSEQALEYFDNTDWILAACPFAVTRPAAGEGLPNTAIQNADGTPTQLGTIFINDQY
ncbi:glycoside hydrolase family 128 protein [Trametes sanguinea]|nr:glycoside hydrolase family 128 protein [Trametes sanguinea]